VPRPFTSAFCFSFVFQTSGSTSHSRSLSRTNALSLSLSLFDIALPHSLIPLCFRLFPSPLSVFGVVLSFPPVFSFFLLFFMQVYLLMRSVYDHWDRGAVMGEDVRSCRCCRPAAHSTYLEGCFPLFLFFFFCPPPPAPSTVGCTSFFGHPFFIARLLLLFCCCWRCCCYERGCGSTTVFFFFRVCVIST
jgi:hypothetical protein